MAAGKYPLAYVFFGSTPTEWSVVQNYLQPDATWNPFGSSDPKLQALMDAVPSASPDERDELFAQINQFVLDNTWFSPWLWVPENFAVNDTVDVTLMPLQNVPFIYDYSPAE